MSTGIGDTLRDARESQGRSLEDAAAALRARVTQLEALEQERFTVFGGDVYAKGFLRSYAVELGLDPQPIMDTYRREVSHDEAAVPLSANVSSTPRQRSAPPAWIAWVLASVVVVAGIVLLGVFSDGRSPDQASPDEPISPPVAPAERDEPDEDPDAGDPSSEDTEPEPDPEPEPEPEPEDPSGVDLLIALEQRSWMRVIVDGSLFLETTVEAGETIPFEAEEEIEIRFGDPGGVRATLNGEDLPPPGSPGQPVTVRYTPEGVDPA
ncbi:MAG: DUF4115 domain-containing protein [Nitriliruptoraceae bacterium]|nr:DUF4115 domain-containing protein [Nitriliruptoraceae bacterium]